MDLDPVFSHIKSKYPWILRSRWTPVLKFQDLTDNKYTSKAGGSNPFRSSNFQWPKCGEIHDGNDEVCGRQKLFWQIYFGDLPDEMKDYIGMDSGMLQIFICDYNKPGKLEDLEMRLIPKKEMIPSLKTLAAINIFKKKVNTDKLPANLVKFVENTNEECKSHHEIQIQTWRKSEFKEIPSSHELKGMAADDELLQSVPRYDYEEIDTRLPISIPDGRLGRLAVKLFGYIKDMGGVGREHYPQCLNCGLAKDKVFLKVPFLTITLCPGCGEPGSVPE